MISSCSVILTAVMNILDVLISSHLTHQERSSYDVLNPFIHTLSFPRNFVADLRISVGSVNVFASQKNSSYFNVKCINLSALQGKIKIIDHDFALDHDS